MKRLAFLLALLIVAPASATVNEVVPFRTDHIASGSGTIFAYTFKILEKTQILVLVNGIERTVDTHYSVQGVSDSGGGTVTFFSPPANGSAIALIRKQPIQQLSIYTANEAFPATRLMTDLDKNIMVDQMQEEELGRALKFGKESLFRDVTVNDPVAGGCLAWSSDSTRVVSTTCGSGSGGGSVPAITTGNVVFGGSSNELSQDTSGGFFWDNASKRLKIARGFHTGNDFTIHQDGLFYAFLKNSNNTTGAQGILSFVLNGTPADTLTTIGNDKVAVAGWAKRGAGGTSPIYGGNFGVVFTTDGVANGVEIDVQNGSSTNNIGQALWLNGSCVGPSDGGGCKDRSNAILIDTQDQTKWRNGILFKEGFVDGGATGSVSEIGIFFNQNQSADFIVIQPRVDTNTNVAMKITDTAFTLNKFELLNNGTIRGYGTSTSAAFPSFSFTDDIDTGMYLEAANTLGWSVDGSRRMTLGATLNVWPSSVSTGLTGTINLFDSTSVHSVGFMAADAIGTSFRYRLPTTPGTNGQCLATDGASPIATLSYAACSGGGGSGTVTTSGSPTTGALALFSSATAITSGNLSGDVTTTGTLVTTMKNTGTAGTYGLVTTDAQGRVSAGTVINDVAHGGTGVATFTANGVLYGNTAGVVLVTAQGAANTVLTANAGAPAFSSTPTIASITTTAQGAVVIGAYGGSANQTGELRFVERTAATDYVGFRAPDAITTSLIWTLPATDSTGTQCLASNGSGVLSWGACSAGSGTGLTSLGGLTGSTQTFTNDTNVTMVSGGTAHVITWAGQLSSTRGGTGQNTSSSTGVPTIATGTWSVLAQLPKSLGGTGTTGGTTGRVPYWGATSLLDNAIFTWDEGSSVLSVGATTAPADVDAIYVVSAPTITQTVARVEAFNTAAATAHRTALQLVRSTNGSMGSGFGVRQDFILRDSDLVDNIAARFIASRGTTGDTSSAFTFQTNVAGTLTDRLTFNDSGQMFFWPTPLVGTLGLLANGTRTTELAFFTPNNTNSVTLVAPASTTGGNHVWRLPTTFGAAGSVLTNNGAGDLSWGSGTLTGSGALGQATFWSSSSALIGDNTILRVALVAGTTAATGSANRSAIQAAHDALPGFGGTIILPAGVFCLDGTPIAFTKPVSIEGQGAMNNYLTRLVAGSTTGNVFTINSAEGVNFRRFQITNAGGSCTSVTRSGTSGAYIKTITTVNGDTRIDDMKFVGHVIGLDMEQAGGWRVTNSYFVGSSTDGSMIDIWGHNTGIDSDNGAYSIDGNTFNNGTAVGAAIKISSGGGPHIVNNSFLGHAVSLHIDWGTTVNSGEINISGNHFDADQFDNINYGIILTSQTTAGIGRIRITDNNFSNHQIVSVVLATPSNPTRISEVTVVGNTFLTKAGALGIEVAATRVFIGSNLFVSTGATTAISVVSGAVDVQIGANSYGLFSTPIVNVVTTTTLSGGILTQAQLPGSIANGSFVGCSDCNQASPCAGGSTGELARRRNGAWVCS